MHWASTFAERIISERGEKKEYICESGVTPSGFCHIGHFREAITTNLVAYALKDMGYKSRHIHMWDDYDRFRKVPANVPASYSEYIGLPDCKVPDPDGCHSSFADHFMEPFQISLADAGMKPDFLRASEQYKNGIYKDNIKISLDKKDRLIELLNSQRGGEKLSLDWYPVSVYCPKCGKDQTKVTSYDGEYGLSYSCKCGFEETADIRKANYVKLKWRVDWPSRWAELGVDYEPYGKDHGTQGGSADTGQKIIQEIFNKPPIIGVTYEFVSLKGASGKMSSSKGNVVLPSDILSVMEPDVLRYMFVKTKPSKELKIALDLDFLNVYDEFDRVETTYFSEEEIEKREKYDKLYEFSNIWGYKSLPAQPSFRFLSVIVQITSDIDRIVKILKKEGHIPKDLSETDLERIKTRAKLAANWVKLYAPDMIKFELLDTPPEVELTVEQKEGLKVISDLIQGEDLTDVELHNRIYEIATNLPIEPKKLFEAIYRVLIGKESGPKAAAFINVLEKDFVVKRFRSY
ncbi:MAG TPA: lysine--tRNA ligase [Methanofastidiosum sp.]|nr:lysine--tRNA ligase [Methanofastidiosum sp.]